MEHKTFARLLPEADTAVLFIHGIMGTPRHFVTRVPLLEAVSTGWSVCNLLLDGHGGDVDDFAHTSMKKWKEQVFEAFHMLCESHARVIVAGHSMGTLFAIQLALAMPEKVPFLFLLATPMRPKLGMRMVMNSMRLVFGLIREDRPAEAATLDACGVQATWKLWKYLPSAPRFLELFLEITRTERRLPELTVPCFSYQSACDELVSRSACRVLERSGRAEVRILGESSHFYYGPRDSERLIKDFISLCKEKTHD